MARVICLAMSVPLLVASVGASDASDENDGLLQAQKVTRTTLAEDNTISKANSTNDMVTASLTEVIYPNHLPFGKVGVSRCPGHFTNRRRQCMCPSFSGRSGTSGDGSHRRRCGVGGNGGKCPAGQFNDGSSDECQVCNGRLNAEQDGCFTTDANPGNCPEGFYNNGSFEECRKCEGLTNSDQTECYVQLYDPDLPFGKVGVSRCPGYHTNRRRQCLCPAFGGKTGTDGNGHHRRRCGADGNGGKCAAGTFNDGSSDSCMSCANPAQENTECPIPTTTTLGSSEGCGTLVPISSDECPAEKAIKQLRRCRKTPVGSMCEADKGACGTDKELNNCGKFDVYRKVAI